MKTLWSLIGAAFLLLAARQTACAYPDDYGPFELDARPKPFPVRGCRLLEGTNTLQRGPDPTSLPSTPTNTPFVPRLNVDRQADPTQVVWSISAADGSLLLAPTNVSDLVFHVEALTADFNRDGKADYAVRTWSEGRRGPCGYCSIVFVLSDGQDFSTQTVDTWCSGPEDFINPKGDGQCLFIHSSYVHGGQSGVGGNGDDYWVYNLLSFGGSTLKCANNMIEGFPKWIRFTKDANHKATTLLTGDQKQRLWKRHADILDRSPPCPKQKHSN